VALSCDSQRKIGRSKNANKCIGKNGRFAAAASPPITTCPKVCYKTRLGNNDELKR
jgi:hypothetical protein